MPAGEEAEERDDPGPQCEEEDRLVHPIDDAQRPVGERLSDILVARVCLTAAERQSGERKKREVSSLDSAKPTESVCFPP
jgi:hypothetical protein